MKPYPSIRATSPRARLARAALAAAAGAWLALPGGCDDNGSGGGPVSAFNATVPAGFVRHRGRGGGVAIKTPPSWRETSTSGVCVLNLRADQKSSSVNLVVTPAAPGETLDKTMAGLPEQFKGEFAEFKLVRNEYIFLKDLPAGRLIYKASRGNFYGEAMVVVVTHGGKQYFLTCTADPENFRREAKVFEQVVASLEID